MIHVFLIYISDTQYAVFSLSLKVKFPFSRHYGVLFPTPPPPPEEGTPYNGLYGEALPERGTFFRLQVYKRVGISQVEVYKWVGKLVI